MTQRIDDAEARDTDSVVAIYLPDLSGGGAERLHVQLAPMLRRLGYAPRLLLDRPGGALFELAMGTTPIDVLGAARQLAALPKLVRYLRRTRPVILLANTEHMNVMAILAVRLARTRTAVIVTQHNSFSDQVARPKWQFRILPLLYQWALPRADAIVAVSHGVARDLAARCGLSADRIDTIHNGVIAEDFDRLASGEAGHAWFADDRPIIMAMGRFVTQKDFVTLIHAFAAIAAGNTARLMILGDGPLRNEMEELAKQAGLADRIAFPGFVANPLPWLKRAHLFVLSSRFEGFGNVLCEAMACGTPVVSTDCPFGPSEILEDGRFGRLVPVGDEAAMGQAIARSLSDVPERAALARRGREFSVSACAEAYVKIFKRLAGRHLAVDD